MLPVQAKEVADRVIRVAQDAVFKLDVEPTSTLDYVTLLTFLEEIQTQTEQLEDDSSVVKELYDLIDKYQVPCPPEDLAMYQVRICTYLRMCLCTYIHHAGMHTYKCTYMHTVHTNIRTCAQCFCMYIHVRQVPDWWGLSLCDYGNNTILFLHTCVYVRMWYVHVRTHVRKYAFITRYRSLYATA